MPSENDPTITIEYFDSTWKSLLAYAKRFTIRDAGVLKIPTADILLKNKGFTSGETKIPYYSPIRMTADVRGVVDDIFQGRLLRYEGDFTRGKHDVRLKCTGYAQNLLRDTITWEYHEYYLNGVAWTMKDVIEDFLGLPDSGVDTGITLVTDSGDILTATPIDDFDRESLLDALRSIAEELNYDGYVYDSPPNLKLNFKEVGTVQANPSIELAHPFISVKPVGDIEEVRNAIYPWGGIEEGIPPSLDRWTEDYDRWADLWTAGAGCTVTDSDAKVQVGTRSIKITNTLNKDLAGTLDITVDPDYDYVDCSAGRFLSLRIHLFNETTPAGECWPTVDLHDDVGNIIRRGRAAAVFRAYWSLIPNKWMIWGNAPVNPDQKIWDTAAEGHNHKEWFYVSGSDFNWKITKVRIWAEWKELASLYVDGIYFVGGADINPLVNPSYYPDPPGIPVKDDTSIGLYGRWIKHIEDHENKTFAQASLAAQRELAALKDPIRKVKAKKGAKTWARPHQVVLLTLPEYDISAEWWRILEVQHDWKSKGNVLRTTFTLVPYTERVSTTAVQMDEVGGIFRSLER